MMYQGIAKYIVLSYFQTMQMTFKKGYKNMPLKTLKKRRHLTALNSVPSYNCVDWGKTLIEIKQTMEERVKLSYISSSSLLIQRWRKRYFDGLCDYTLWPNLNTAYSFQVDLGLRRYKNVVLSQHQTWPVYAMHIYIMITPIQKCTMVWF